MNIGFRVDASIHIGSGHVMRCLTLAKALSGYGSSTFYCRALPGNLISFIEASGFRCIPLIGEEKFSQAEDAQQCLAEGMAVDLLIIDHYQLGSEFCLQMRQCAKAVMVIDDLANRQHHCDLLLDQNLFRDYLQRYDELVPSECCKLLGPTYALLRDEFYTTSTAPLQNSILVGFGGTDEGNLTGTTINALAKLKLSGLQADIVVGKSNPWINDLLAVIEKYPWMTLHIQCNYMANLMTKACVMIGSGGTTHWERCKTGLPAIVITTADNQRDTTAALQEKGACLWLGETQEVNEADIRDCVSSLLDNPAKRQAMSVVAKQLIPDDAGTPHVVKAIMHYLRG